MKHSYDEDRGNAYGAVPSFQEVQENGKIDSSPLIVLLIHPRIHSRHTHSCSNRRRLFCSAPAGGRGPPALGAQLGQISLISYGSMAKKNAQPSFLTMWAHVMIRMIFMLR